MIAENMKELVAGSSIIRAMFEEGKALTEKYGAQNVYDFSLGNPNVAPPDEIITIINDILVNEQPKLVHGYMNNSGFESTRAVIANSLNEKYNLDLASDNLAMTVGAAGALNIILKCILNPADEVIVFAPFFGEYTHYVSNFGAKLVVIPANYPTFEPNIQMLESAITERTKAVIINTPNNPTGVVYTEQLLTQLTETLRKKSAQNTIYLISDEPYREIVYDNVDVPCVLPFYDNTFIAYSYSKSLSLAGERIGYVCMNSNMESFEDMIQALRVANRILGFVNAPSLFQKVIEKCVDVEVDISLYKLNRDILYKHLTDLGFVCVYPQGAFYLFPKAPISDDVLFCMEAKKFNLLLVPGSAFGCPGYFRVSYCVSNQTVINSLDAFTKLAKIYK
ncbi:MAG: aspartate aminotransferase [Epulopiscium sp. Nuni2H_MBin001]|nr:MAG: aspartate aminotransferase [Epulopiscium sp. Nuni2H_MBin001]